MAIRTSSEKNKKQKQKKTNIQEPSIVAEKQPCFTIRRV
jgi:hypothetical protein